MQAAIKIITLGKFKETAFKDLEKEYLKRLKRFTNLKIIELDEYGYKSESEIPKAKAVEEILILKNLKDEEVVILLDEKGIERNSRDFSGFIERLASIGKPLTFIIGSGVGVSEGVKGRANYKISLSSLTFTHNFARVLLEEQLFRAFKIMEGGEYHKD